MFYSQDAFTYIWCIKWKKLTNNKSRKKIKERLTHLFAIYKDNFYLFSVNYSLLPRFLRRFHKTLIISHLQTCDLNTGLHYCQDCDMFFICNWHLYQHIITRKYSPSLLKMQKWKENWFHWVTKYQVTFPSEWSVVTMIAESSVSSSLSLCWSFWCLPSLAHFSRKHSHHHHHHHHCQGHPHH